MIDPGSIQRNLETVKERIAAAARLAGRDSAEIRLVVVTKGHPAGALQALFDLGIREFGESYIEEGRAKQVALAHLAAVKWHMIGHVQSRKAQAAAENFDLIHSLDSLKLARRLDRFAGQSGRKLPVLLECNVGGEASKTGWPVAKKKDRKHLFAEVEEILELPNLQITGLMSIAPVVEKPELARPYFERTRLLRDALAERFTQAHWKELSIGMSDDFESAILEGATMLRIGTAILGQRPD